MKRLKNKILSMEPNTTTYKAMYEGLMIVENPTYPSMEGIDKEGIEFLYSPFFTTCERFLDLPRKQELMALVNRMRKINMLKEGGSI